MADYAAHGAKEYWLIDTEKQAIEQYLLDEKSQTFQLFARKTKEDSFSCRIIAGCSFPVAAVFDEKEKMKTAKNWLQ